MSNSCIILLNGTSSAGKTTIAKALQEKLVEPYMYLSLDIFFHLYPEKVLNPTNQKELDTINDLIPRIVSGFHQCIASLVKAGNCVIVDHVLQEQDWLKDCVNSWMDLEVLFIGVECPLEIVEKRERERGDRNIGTARYQIDRVHAHGLYDLVVDTSLLSTERCVDMIIDKAREKPQLTAFQALSSQFSP